MSENDQQACPICGLKFQEGEPVIVFRVWPEPETLGHAGCVFSVSLEEDEED